MGRIAPVRRKTTRIYQPLLRTAECQTAPETGRRTHV